MWNLYLWNTQNKYVFVLNVDYGDDIYDVFDFLVDWYDVFFTGLKIIIFDI